MTGCLLGLLAPSVVAQSVGYTINSDPAGFVAQSGAGQTGQSISTPVAPDSSAGYTFGYWTLNGVRQPAAEDGASPPAITFTLDSANVATAVYFSTSLDSDSDGVPDWYEWRHFGSLAHDGADDPDGDGFGLKIEAYRQYSPLLEDTVTDGGIASRRSGSLLLATSGTFAYAISSAPAGILDQSSVVAAGTSLTTPVPPEDPGGRIFSYWTVNGVRQADANGVALPVATFTVSSATTAVAVYLFPTEDNDADGLPDWFEWQQFGSLDQSNGADDPDGDGFTVAVEAYRRYSPILVDLLSDGGVASRRSTMLTIATAESLPYSIVSSPFGILSESGVAPSGTTITTPSAPDHSGSYFFGYWSINGVPQGSSPATPSIDFTVTDSMTVTANYFPADEDTDADGVPDWFEWRQFGRLDLGGGNFDPDGDGFDATTEAHRGYSPALLDLIADGGIASRRSAPILLASTTPSTGYEDWATGYFTPEELATPARSGPNAVYGDDGLPNLVKYALGLNPKANVTSGLPEVSVTETNWTYTYSRPGSRPELTYEVEVSTDLADWSANGVSLTLVSVSDGLETWQATYPVANAANIFFRLKISE